VAVGHPNRVKVNQLIILLSGLVLLTAALLIFLLVLKNVYGKYNFTDIIPSEKIFKIFQSNKKQSVALLYSRYTENMLPEGSTWLSDNITTWKKFLDEEKINYDVISDQTIELGKHFNYDLLILAGSKSLSDKEISQIKRYIEKGGSIFASSGTASYSADGKWRGWEFFSEVYGLKFTKEIIPDDILKIHTLRGNLPLTAGIPTGYPLKIATWDRPIACEVLEPRTTQVSFWYNFRKEGGLVREEIEKTAGIVYGNYGKGRFVWYGFELNSVIGEQIDYIYFEKLFKNSINWLTYSPTLQVRDWPPGYKTAAMIVPMLTNKIWNVKNLFSIAKNEDVPMTFFIDPAVADENKQLVKALNNYGEIGDIIDIGYLVSTTDTVDELFDYNTQLNRFRQGKSVLEKIPGIKINGVLPLYGLYNENSVRALINAGYSYIMTDSLTDRSVPKTLIRDNKRIVSFTKTARDDYEVIRDYGLKDTSFQLYTYEEDVDRLMFEGGLYIFKIHTDYQCLPEYVNVVRDLIKYLKRKNFWIATGSQIKNWWLSKSNLEISSEVRSQRRIAIEVSNPGNTVVENVMVQVNINKNVKNIQLSSEIFGTTIPKYEFDSKSQTIILKIKKLGAGESVSYFIDFDSVNT
jgi:peptidoglycan/xylan/chitin deacetylase (PgdA/CDA1 family)